MITKLSFSTIVSFSVWVRVSGPSVFLDFLNVSAYSWFRCFFHLLLSVFFSVLQSLGSSLWAFLPLLVSPVSVILVSVMFPQAGVSQQKML